MTLLLTIGAPDVLVMVADSALSQRTNEGVVALSGFPKIFYIAERHMAISFTGPAILGGTYMHLWLRSFCGEIAESANPEDFARELASTLNDVGGARDCILAFQIGTWIRTGDPEYPLPIVWEVSNHDLGEFRATPLIDKDTADAIGRWQTDKSSYPFRIYTAGLPTGYAAWIGDMLPRYSKLVGGSVPQPNGSSLVSLAEFLVRQFSDLLAIAGKPGVVSEPVLTRILLPTPTLMITRFM